MAFVPFVSRHSLGRHSVLSGQLGGSPLFYSLFISLWLSFSLSRSLFLTLSLKIWLFCLLAYVCWRMSARVVVAVAHFPCSPAFLREELSLHTNKQTQITHILCSASSASCLGGLLCGESSGRITHSHQSDGGPKVFS